MTQERLSRRLGIGLELMGLDDMDHAPSRFHEPIPVANITISAGWRAMRPHVAGEEAPARPLGHRRAKDKV